MWELAPPQSSKTFHIKLPWKTNAGTTLRAAHTGKPFLIDFAPYKLGVWDVAPVKHNYIMLSDKEAERAVQDPLDTFKSRVASPNPLKT